MRLVNLEPLQTATLEQARVTVQQGSYPGASGTRYRRAQTAADWLSSLNLDALAESPLAAAPMPADLAASSQGWET